ncbi:hypothetical protein T06_15613 [Trichinella sp. T6]|nr:hypothetical protein T06_15613 [Trichinella sp. T6]
MRANRKHHSDSQWDIVRFNSHIINYQDSLVITDYMDFRKYFPTAEFLAEFVQKIIRLVYVVETLMLFQERYVITIVCRGVAQLILDNEMIRICSRI